MLAVYRAKKNDPGLLFIIRQGIGIDHKLLFRGIFFQSHLANEPLDGGQWWIEIGLPHCIVHWYNEAWLDLANDITCQRWPDCLSTTNRDKQNINIRANLFELARR
jgi:hypothetical protein